MLDFDRDPSVAEQRVGQMLNPTNPDLSGFAKRGGKIIVYHGWADDMVPSDQVIWGNATLWGDPSIWGESCMYADAYIRGIDGD